MPLWKLLFHKFSSEKEKVCFIHENRNKLQKQLYTMLIIDLLITIILILASHIFNDNLLVLGVMMNSLIVPTVFIYDFKIKINTIKHFHCKDEEFFQEQQRRWEEQKRKFEEEFFRDRNYNSHSRKNHIPHSQGKLNWAFNVLGLEKTTPISEVKPPPLTYKKV